MKFVVKYDYSDGCSYSFPIVEPVEYESAEALIVDLEEAAWEFFNDQKSGNLFFAGIEWPVDMLLWKDFDVDEEHRKAEFEVLTIDEWFAQK